MQYINLDVKFYVNGSASIVSGSKIVYSLTPRKDISHYTGFGEPFYQKAETLMYCSIGDVRSNLSLYCYILPYLRILHITILPYLTGIYNPFLFFYQLLLISVDNPNIRLFFHLHGWISCPNPWHV